MLGDLRLDKEAAVPDTWICEFLFVVDKLDYVCVVELGSLFFHLCMAQGLQLVAMAAHMPQGLYDVAW